MDFQPMNYIYKPSGDPKAITLLLLHGTGGNEHDLIPLAESFGSDINVLSLKGNVNENGMPRFFKRIGMGIFDEEDLEFRTNEMLFFIKKLAAEMTFDISKIVALGYSNGANIAGATLILYPDFFKGAILFRPMKPFKNIKSEHSLLNTSVFMSSGKNDPTVNQNEIDEYAKDLKNSGFNVTNFSLNASHNLTQQDLDMAVEWFKSL